MTPFIIWWTIGVLAICAMLPFQIARYPSMRPRDGIDVFSCLFLAVTFAVVWPLLLAEFVVARLLGDDE